MERTLWATLLKLLPPEPDKPGKWNRTDSPDEKRLCVGTIVAELKHYMDVRAGSSHLEHQITMKPASDLIKSFSLSR